MAKITAAQKNFLRHHQIPLGRVFDASGLRPGDYKRQMSAIGKLVAVGVTACGKAGHTMRTSAGHCAECRPAGLAYLLRYNSPGEVYVAKTGQGRIVKVGSSVNAMERVGNLNAYKYGGVSDWKIAFCEATSTAGRIEFAAHRILSKHAISATYFKDGRDIDCREIFNCSASVAIKAVGTAIASASPACSALVDFEL